MHHLFLRLDSYQAAVLVPEEKDQAILVVQGRQCLPVGRDLYDQLGADHGAHVPIKALQPQQPTKVRTNRVLRLIYSPARKAA